MKDKHLGLVGVSIAGLALLVIIGELIWVSCAPHFPRGDLSGFEVYPADRILVDPDAVKRMDLVEPTLPKLVRPQAVDEQALVGDVSGIDYAMFGDRPPKKEKPRTVWRPSPSKPYPHRVTMTYLSGDHRYAVINKKLYTESSSLPNGEVLAEISDGAVRLESRGKKRWISVEHTGD